MTDPALVQRAIDGDQEAYAALVRSAARRLYLVAHRILRDSDAAEDAVQQTLLIIWKELPRLRDADRFEGWSYRIVTRAALAEAKRRGRSRNINEIAGYEPTTGAVAQMVEDRDAIERAFRRLTPETRAVVVLRYYADLPLKDIGDVLGIPAGTVGSRLHRAMRDMRAVVSRDEPPGPTGTTGADARILAREPAP